MIAASEPQEFVPFGRQQMKHHPGVVAISNILKRGHNEAYLAQRFSQVNLDDNTQEWWTLRNGYHNGSNSCETNTEGIAIEEELYLSGRTVIVSRGSVGRSVSTGKASKNGGRILKVCYSMECPVHQALWCQFPDTLDKDKPKLCILDSDKISVYCDGGSDYTTPLQFKVTNAWATKFGLLIERVVHYHLDRSTLESCGCEGLTTLFSLLHPLDEISPVLSVKQGGVLSYMNDPFLKIVFTSEEPSLCLIHNIRTGTHSIWKIRKALAEECQWMCGQESGMTVNTTATNMSGSNLSTGSVHLNVSMRAVSLNRSVLMGSGAGSPLFGRSNTSQALMHSLSPHSPHHYSVHSPLTNYSPKTYGNFVKESFTSSASSVEARLGGSIAPQIAEPKPIVPELCLEYVWTETSTPRSYRDQSSMASKSFLSKDTLGQEYLCYLVNSSLVLVRLNRTNNTRMPELIVGSVSSIPAKDAVPIPALQMIAILEAGGCVMLYTGCTTIGKLHIAGISAELASVSYLTNISLVTTINSPFPKGIEPRNNLLSSTRIGEGTFDERVYLLSPVTSSFNESQTNSSPGDMQQPTGSREAIQSLRDPVGTRFTIEYSNGSMFRFALPEFASSPLVRECIKVLKCILQKDIALLTIAKWYTTRNAPGTQDISPKQEWHLFISCLLDLLGYQLEFLPLVSYYLHSDCDTPAKNTKKMRASDLGSNDDWSYLISSAYHDMMCQDFGLSLGLHEQSPNCHGYEQNASQEGHSEINTSALLYPYFHLIVFSFHLLYEEIKLKPILYECLPLLTRLLHQLCSDLRLHEYCSYYWRDFPNECTLTNIQDSQISDEEVAKFQWPSFMSKQPCSIFEQIYGLVTKEINIPPYLYITGVNTLSRNILEILGMLMNSQKENLRNVVPPGSRSTTPHMSMSLDPMALVPSSEHKAVLLMNKLGMNRQDLLNLPCGIGLILGCAVQNVTESGVQGWPLGACRLISRLDLVPGENNEELSQHHPNPEEILTLRFNKDQRVEEARRLLNSSEPVTINVTQRSDVTDIEFVEEQERCLYAICTRTMALPVGRGMMDLHTTVPVVITEQLNIPKLCLVGKAPPRGTTVELNHIEVVPNMNLWPLFHNGVAAGLKISPLSKNIDSTWILYNKPKNGIDALPEHAGFLMGLGLSGHLNNLMHLYLYNYLNKCHEMTSVGILLGLAASKRGTMDVRVTKLFSLHIESLLPPTSIELNLVQNIQVAALLGIGLVYQGTGHRHIAEALLSEIGRPPGPEMENSCDRECYSLAAGLGLGLVVLGKGADPTTLADLDLADTLQYYMIGGHRRPLTGSQKEKYKSPSYQIREGDCVNNHVTGPGATLALAMMYFNTGNIAIANWLEAPDSEYMLDFICPDQLLLRTLAKGLVMWDQIIPTVSWVEAHIPASIRPYCLVKPREGLEDVDLETMSQAYCHIIAGACMALGLRFAGSANNRAFETLLHYCKLFTSLSSKSIAELAGKSTIETCICVTLLSLSVVMAGTGDLEVLRLCRHLGSRVGQVTNSVVTYGSHLAVHMALGLLFLGGGSLGLSTRPESVAAMICAFFPRFPTHSNDNRYHLQAFRHLYVLAVEPRLFLPKDIDHGSLSYVNLKVVYLDTPYYKNQSIKLFAPCLLPELHLLKEVKIEDERYWSIVFTKGKNWTQLEETLKKGGTIGIKLRAGCLPYADDPHGYKTLLAQTISTDTASSWTTSAEAIQAFVLDKTCNFPKHFLETSENDSKITNRELKLIQWMSNICYECVTKNKLPLLDYWINLLTEVMRLKYLPSSIISWQIRLAIAHGIKLPQSHLQADHIMAINQYIKAMFKEWQLTHSDILLHYLKGQRVKDKRQTLPMLTSYLTFYGMPNEIVLEKLQKEGKSKLCNLVQAASKEGCRLPTSVLKLLWDLFRICNV
ncbi:anaphase-promoting complex subunit 1 isoform X2 [Cimex lectularius]|uniref:Anaphase-promoting complex subunit 1 n=1 Tax=Cimex lectularius TaxID=79782 RepID=A0A8I6SAT3_CIMLE|nr:anaphase-promoting complex subunit 1 isoform X2 [Cimex lectularius]